MAAPLPPALAALLQQVPAVATNDLGIVPEEQRLAKDIQAFGAVAVPHVVPLLRSDNARVRRLAGYIVRDLPGLTEAHLDELMVARRAGDEWVPVAIGRVGSARAVRFLVEDLRAHPERMTQLTFALRAAGAPAAVALARLFEAGHVSDELGAAMCEVFGELGRSADAAIDVLVAHIRNDQATMASRNIAAAQLGCMGSAASRAAPQLLALASSQPKLRDAVEAAVVAMGAPESVPFLVDALRAGPDLGVLRDIASKGERVQAVGPDVVPFLRSRNRTVRVAAARTLGFIGHGDSAPALTKMLADADDWQAVYVAAESLGRLKATAALPELDRVARDHWFAPARDAARKAATVVRGAAQYEPSTVPQNFGAEFFAYESVVGPPADAPAPTLRGPNELSPEALKAHTYDAEIAGWKHEQRSFIRQTPDAGLKIPGGHLLGADRGEFGGELMFVPAGGAKPRRLLKQNVLGIHELGTRIVVVADLGSWPSRGALYVVTTDAAGKHEATFWKTLPGAPRTSGVTRDGRLHVWCDGGDVIIRADGRMAAP